MSEYKNDNQSNLKNDKCYINQQNKSNKSIFSYITDTTMFINKNQCFDVTPPFLNYIPNGIPNQNIDIENNLRGAIRYNSKCDSCKFIPNKEDIKVNINENLCSNEFKILPNGFYNNQTR